MAQPGEKLAEALDTLRQLQAAGKIAIRSTELPRPIRERLVDAGFLQEVIRGWYIPARPDEPAGETTSWFANFWGFSTAYLTERFGEEWILSPDQSLLLLSGNSTVPRQLLVRAPGGRNKPTDLIHRTSLIDTKAALPPEADRIATDEGLRVYRIEAALIAVSPQFYINFPTDARTALATQRDPSALLQRLLDGGHSVVAGRLAGGYRNIGHDRIADEITRTMKAAGYEVRETDPFEQRLEAPLPRGETPAATRIRLMWNAMRERAIEAFPEPPRENDVAAYLERVEENYVTDAYNSLSIEGYRVSEDLIEKVRDGNWNPDTSQADRQQKDAMAARGYWQAFKAVKESVGRVLSGENGGKVADDDHPLWYRELFAASVAAGILKASELAGYRGAPVYIRGARHVPMSQSSVRDALPAFFELLQEETAPAARVVLGHFIFVYIHPYIDGNGRMGRFLMNVMMAAGGYPWTVIPVERRAQYMAALESASSDADIGPFADFLGGLVKEQLEKPS